VAWLGQADFLLGRSPSYPSGLILSVLERLRGNHPRCWPRL